MRVTIGKTVSLVIAGGCVAFMVADGGVTGLGYSALILLPLALIWFPDEIGNATGYLGDLTLRVDTPTPPILISIMGWFFLVGLPVLFYFIT